MQATIHDQRDHVGALSEAVRTWSELTNTGFLLCGLANITNLADIGVFLEWSRWRGGVTSANPGAVLAASQPPQLWPSATNFFCWKLLAPPPYSAVSGPPPLGQANTSEERGNTWSGYELKGHPTDAALPPLQAASEEAALGTFARELNFKLDFAEEGETGEYVLTNTSTWTEWWVVISG